MSLEGLRKEIGEVTEEILRLVARRMELAKKIGEVKRELGLSVDQPEVERALMRKALEEARELGLDERLASRLLSLLIAESARVQRRDASSVFFKARELAKERRLIRLEVGEPDFGPPKPVVEELCRSAKEGYVKYSTASGIPELREAIADHLRQKLGIDLKKEEVLVTPGGRMALYLAMATSLTVGSRVLIFEPYWPAYRDFTEHLGSKPVILRTELEEGWEPDLEEVKDVSADMALINYPDRQDIGEGEVRRAVGGPGGQGRRGGERRGLLRLHVREGGEEHTSIRLGRGCHRLLLKELRNDRVQDRVRRIEQEEDREDDRASKAHAH